MNRHRANWSAMGSPRQASAIFAGIEAREQWHQAVLSFWRVEGLTYLEAMEPVNIERVERLIVGRFRWTIEGLEELYLMRMPQVVMNSR